MAGSHRPSPGVSGWVSYRNYNNGLRTAPEVGPERAAEAAHRGEVDERKYHHHHHINIYMGNLFGK